jgi:hypothetical protein
MIYTGNGSVGPVPNVEKRITDKIPLQGGRAVGTANQEKAYNGI